MRITKAGGLFPFFFLILSFSSRTLAEAPYTKAQGDALEESLSAVFSSSRSPGMSVALIWNHQLAWELGLGLADLESGQAALPGTAFGVGSLAHSVVGLAVMRLDEEGVMGPESRLADLLPGPAVENPWEGRFPIRVAHLMEHTAGLQDVPPRELMHKTSDLLEVIQASRVECRSRWSPGSFVVPSAYGPALAAWAVERTVGQPFREWSGSHIFQPLGMETAGFEGGPREVPAGRSYGPEGEEAPPWSPALRNSLGLVASVRDLSKMMLMLMARGPDEADPFLARESKERMEMSGTAPSGRQGVRVGYGIGLRTFLTSGFVFLGYEGRAPGGWSTFRYSPRHGRGFALIFNGGDRGDFLEAVALLSEALTQDLERPMPPVMDLPPGRIAAVSGYYRPLTPRLEALRFFSRMWDVVPIAYAGGKLDVRTTAGREVQLFPVTDRRFRAEGEPIPTVVFSRDEDGRAVVEAFSEEFQGNFVRASGLAVWLERLALALTLALLSASLLVGFGLLVRSLWSRSSSSLDGALLVCPALAALSLGAAALLVWTAVGSMTEAFGQLSISSAGLFVGSLFFPLVSFLGLGIALWNWRGHRSYPVWILALTSTAAASCWSVYLGYWGVIGIRSWA